jgi:hypothetical protein
VAVATDAASEAATATDKTLYLLYFISSPLNYSKLLNIPYLLLFFSQN